MTAIQKCAVIHDVSQDLVFCADLFALEGVIVVQAYGPIEVGKNAFAPDDRPTSIGEPTHELHERPHGFSRGDLGIYVVAAAQIVRRV